jgi:hypothetical protein
MTAHPKPSINRALSRTSGSAGGLRPSSHYGNGNDRGRCDLYELPRLDGEDSSRGAGGGPNDVMVKQMLVQIGMEWLTMSDRRYSSDSEPSASAHKFGRSLLDRAHYLRQASFVDAVDARSEDEHRFVSVDGSKHERFHYLRNVAANGGGGFRGGPGTFRHLDDFAGDSPSAQFFG